jgi:hypothetical protein
MPEPKRATNAPEAEQTAKPTLEREHVAGPGFAGPEIAIEQPTSRGELAEPAKPEQDRAREEPRPAEPAGEAIRSRRATNEEAAARLGAMDFDDETSERIGQAMGHAIRHAEAAGVRDEIGDEEAAMIAAGPIEQRVRMEARRAEQIPNFDRDDDRHDELGPPKTPVPPTTLPALINRLPAFVDDEVKWLGMSQVPGYMVNAIRALGRSTFRCFPCFLDHERKERERGARDPLASITLLANFQGQNGPSPRRDLDRMAQWIAENGNRVEADELEFPGAFPGYHPEIVLLTTEEESFLMVRDTRANGAPVEGVYIYRWGGGAAAYRLQDGRVHLGRLEARGPAPRQIAAPAREPQRPGLLGRLIGNAGAAPRPAAPPRADLARVARNDPAELARQAEMLRPGRPADDFLTVRRRGVRRDLPTARDATAAIAEASDLKRLRDLGFVPHSNVEGPGLQYACEDGRSIRLMAQPGNRLIDTPTFRMTVTSTDGEKVSTDEAGVDEILAQMAPAGPRP